MEIRHDPFRPQKSLLAIQPSPFVDQEKQLVVLWSPKAACTMVYAWFASVCGFLGEVRSFHRFPHQHRTRVFQRSERYHQSLNCDTVNFRIVKVIRDPYERAVSIFRHALEYRFADWDLAKWQGGALGFETTGVSFLQFLDLLSMLDMSESDPHYQAQVHPFEAQQRPDVIINVSKQDLFEELNVFEMLMGWPKTDFSQDWLHRLPTSQRTPGNKNESATDQTPLRRGAVFPGYTALLTPTARQKIEFIYGADFEAYRSFL